MNRIAQPSLWARIGRPACTNSALAMGRLMYVRFLSSIGKVEHVKVLFGSQTGTAMGFADELGEALQAAGIKAEVQDPGESSWTSDTMPLKDGDTVVLVQACAGQGEPTDNATEMYNFLTRIAQPDLLKGVNYTIFGLGNQQTYCQNFNKVARDLDAAMERLGATRIFQRGEGDDSKCIEADFEEWQGKFIAALQQGIQEPAAKAPEPMGVGQCTPQGPRRLSKLLLNSVPAAAAWHDPARLCTPFYDKRTVLDKVLYNTDLTPQSAPQRQSREMGLDITHHDQIYETGDHFAIYPQNDTSLVKGLAEHMGWDLRQCFTLAPNANNVRLPFGGPVNTYEALVHHLDLTATPTPAYLRTLADFADVPAQARAIKDLAAPENYTKEVKNAARQLRHLIADYPSLRLPLDHFIEITPRMHPRLYSIASSAKVDPQVVRLTYRAVVFPTADGSPHHGVCSTYMLGLAQGDVLPGYIRPSTFRLPADPTVPLVMIAGGTGIAPMKAFIDERIMLQAQGTKLGPCLLYYGVNDPSELIYGDFLAKEAKNASVEVHITYANEGHTVGGMRFPTDRLAVDGAQLWDLIHTHKAFIYVCGGSSGYGRAVAATLQQLYVQHGAMQEDVAEEFHFSLKLGGRLHEDLAD